MPKLTLVAVLAGLTLSGCDSPNPMAIPDGSAREPEAAPTSGLKIENAILTISNLAQTTVTELGADEFNFLFLWVNDLGLFVIGVDGPTFAEEAGSFAGKTLEFSCAGTDVSFVNETRAILNGGENRPALVTFFRNFNMGSSDERPPDLVLGVVEVFKQIPGFEERNLPPESCSH